MKQIISLNTLMLVLLLFLIGGCSPGFIGDIKKSSFPETRNTFKTLRNVQIVFDSIIDKRPTYEIKGKSFAGLYYLIPLIIFDSWSSSNSSYTSGENYDISLIPSLTELMQNVLLKSNVYSTNNAPKKYFLKTELLHYYAFHYTKSSTWCIWIIYPVSTTNNDYYFFPTGFVSMKLTLTDSETMKPVSTRYISNGFMFNPNAEGLSNDNTAYGISQDKTEQCVQVASLALKDLMVSLPDVIDEMLAEQGNLTSNLEINTFKLIRLTNDYNFQEEVLVEYETGNILKSEVVKRKTPILSKPDEWIVAPVNDDGRYLSNAQYNDLIITLQQKYDVSFGSNLSAANFYGSK